MTPGIAIDCEQGTDVWFAARCGLITASRASDVVACTKKGEGAGRRDYRHELIYEILTGKPYPQHVSKEMQWGINQEPFARAAYEMQRGVLVETCGFILHSEIARFGASPDGLVGDDGLIQIKCPNTTTHLRWILSGEIPVDHMPQMLAELSCTGRDWCDFVSFDPRLPSHLQLFIRRFARDQQFITMLELEVLKLNGEIEDQLAALPQKPQGIVLAMDHFDPEEMVF
jgi:putative phage-type endonuclease